MKSIKPTDYNSLWKGIRAIKVLYASCFSCGCYLKLRINLFDCPDSDIKAFPYSE